MKLSIGVTACEATELSTYNPGGIHSSARQAVFPGPMASWHGRRALSSHWKLGNQIGRVPDASCKMQVRSGQ